HRRRQDHHRERALQLRPAQRVRARAPGERQAVARHERRRRRSSDLPGEAVKAVRILALLLLGLGVLAVRPAFAADIEVWENHCNAGVEAESQGALRGAIKSFLASVTAAEPLSSKDPWPLVISLNKVASLYKTTGDMKRAEANYDKALRLVKGVFGGA